MYRRIKPANGYCLYFPNRKIGSRFEAGRGVRVWFWEEWKQIALGQFTLKIPSDNSEQEIVTTADMLECGIQANFHIIVGGEEEGIEKRLQKATISCPTTRNINDKIDLSFFRYWAINYCRTSIVRILNKFNYADLIEQLDSRKEISERVYNDAKDSLEMIGLILVSCDLIIEPIEPRSVLVTKDVLDKWLMFRKTLDEAELAKRLAEHRFDESIKQHGYNRELALRESEEIYEMKLKDFQLKILSMENDYRERKQELELKMKKLEESFNQNKLKLELDFKLHAEKLKYDFESRKKNEEIEFENKSLELELNFEQRKREYDELKRKIELEQKQFDLKRNQMIAANEEVLINMRRMKFNVEFEIEETQIRLGKEKTNLHEKISLIEGGFTNLIPQQNEILERQENLSLRQNIIESNLRIIQQDLYKSKESYFKGIDSNILKIHRYIPIRIYLDESDIQKNRIIENALINFIDKIGFEVSNELLPEFSSFFKKMIAKSKETLTQPDMSDLLIKGKRAIELQTLHKNQAIIDKMQAEAAAILLSSLGNANAIVQIGSILIIKLCDDKGNVNAMARTLTQNELIFLEQNPNLFKNPAIILNALSEHNKNDNLKNEIPQDIHESSPEEKDNEFL